jgi:hypothetical protein
MKKIIILISLFIVSLQSFSQTITYKDLLFIMNNEETEKIDDVLNKKGFMLGEVSNSNDCGSFDWNYKNTERKLSNVQMIKKLCDEQNNKVVLYTSTNSSNYEIIRKEVIKLGYKKIGENTYGDMLNIGYQKGKYRFQFSKKMYKEIEENNQKIIDYTIVLRVQKD